MKYCYWTVVPIQWIFVVFHKKFANILLPIWFLAVCLCPTHLFPMPSKLPLFDCWPEVRRTYIWSQGQHVLLKKCMIYDIWSAWGQAICSSLLRSGEPGRLLLLLTILPNIEPIRRTLDHSMVGVLWVLFGQGMQMHYSLVINMHNWPRCK